MRKTLTQPTVHNTKPPASGRLEITDVLLPGLVVRIGANGYRSYVVRGRIHGRLEAPIRAGGVEGVALWLIYSGRLSFRRKMTTSRRCRFRGLK